MNRWRSQPYVLEGQRRGIAAGILDAARATADSLLDVSPNLPPLFTLKHLAVETDVSYKFLREVVSRKNHAEHYRVFKLKKASVGHAADRFRYICVPHPLLLRAQRWIHSNILIHVRCHEASSAYHVESRIAETARMHCGCRWLIKLDITSFFESILEPSVYNAFHKMGYQPLVSFELGRLCTRLRSFRNPARYESARKDFEIWDYSNAYLGHLPQGAPTSPLLANIIAEELDRRISVIAQQFELVYTRYADDIALSTKSKSFTREKCYTVIHEVQWALREHGFWPNRTKTKILPPRARKIVLGLLVDTDRPRLTHEFKERLRTHVHFLSHPQVGPASHARHRGFDSVLGLQHHVFGLAAFAAGIEPTWGAQCLEALRAVPWPTSASGFPWR